MNPSGAVLIPGCPSGIGCATVEHLVAAEVGVGVLVNNAGCSQSGAQFPRPGV